MSKRNDDFFKEKKGWSVFKDQLLEYYLNPYFQKIAFTSRPLVYVDCFAGRGSFEDGAPGSPLIALNVLQKAKAKTTKEFNTRCYFIELNYANELKDILAKTTKQNYEVISGKYEDNIRNILLNSKGKNIFLYFDPYGIKAIDMALFKTLSQSNAFYSAELLMNFNSFGMFRECCKIRNITFNDKPLSGLTEYDASHVDQAEQMNAIAGGDWWIEIVDKYKNNEIDSHEAEKLITKRFCSELRKSFKYVINLPIKSTDDKMPKYQLIHATNHSKGCILMGDNMFKRSQYSREARRDGQMSILDTIPDVDFRFTVDDDIVSNREIDERILTLIGTNNMSRDELQCQLYNKYGVICDSKHFEERLKELKNNNQTIETRMPHLTKRGKETAFYAESNNQKLWIRRYR